MSVAKESTEILAVFKTNLWLWAHIKKRRQVILPSFSCYYNFSINLRLETEWFCKKDNQNHNKGIDTERFDHCKTDNECCGDLS